MKFEEKPDIAYLRKLFKDLFYKSGFEYDYVFDWMVKKPQVGGMPTAGKDDDEQDGRHLESSKALPEMNND